MWGTAVTSMKSKGTGKMKAAEARNRRRGTWVACPSCGKPSRTYVRSGEVEIHCKECNEDFEVVIRPLGGRAAAPASPDKTFLEPAAFLQGEMVFHPDRIELCGVTIITDRGSEYSIRMMAALRHRRNSRYVRLSATRLAGLINAPGVGTITGCAKTIRDNITERLRADLNIECGKYDVLDHGKQGYFLRESITVRDGASEDDAPPEAAPEPGRDSLERREWVLRRLREGRPLCRADLEREFGIAERTAKRDLNALVKRGEIEFVRKPHPGRYRLAK